MERCGFRWRSAEVGLATSHRAVAPPSAPPLVAESAGRCAPDSEPLKGAIAVVNYAAIALSALAAVLALALARKSAAAVARRMLLAGAWAACTLLALRGAGGLVQGVLADGEWSEQGSDALVIGFEGLFLLGGVLFGLAAREYSRATRLRQ